MARASMSTTRRPVVLLVQPSRDDSLDAGIVVTGMHLDDSMDGVELVSRVRDDDRTRSTPIIVLTACAWPKDRESNMSATPSRQ